MRGIIKCVFPEKGWGFIATIDHDDVFVHKSAVREKSFSTLEEGEEVEFDIGPGRTGRLSAYNVIRIESQPGEPRRTFTRKKGSPPQVRKSEKKTWCEHLEDKWGFNQIGVNRILESLPDFRTHSADT